MAKTVNEVLTKMKGDGKIYDTITGKGAFSRGGWADVVNAFVNDNTFKVKIYDKDGKVSGEMSISELIRNDLKKTLEKAHYPQKSEANILENCEIVTTGLAEAIPQIVMQQICAGRKFDLPGREKVQGSIYLADVPGRTKETVIRDPKSQTVLGTVTVTSQDSIAVKAKSSVPEYLQTKVRKDTNGKIVS